MTVGRPPWEKDDIIMRKEGTLTETGAHEDGWPTCFGCRLRLSTSGKMEPHTRTSPPPALAQSLYNRITEDLKHSDEFAFSGAARNINSRVPSSRKHPMWTNKFHTCYLFETGRTALFSGAALPVFLSYHPCFFFRRFSKMICSRRSSRSFSCCLRSSTCRAQSEKF